MEKFMSASKFLDTADTDSAANAQKYVTDTGEDTRNLIDEYKGLSNGEVFARLAEKRSGLEVAIFNVLHDFNAGTIVRNANNFNVSRVHIIGNKKYNRRGAMCTDKYLEICHWGTLAEFLASQHGRELVAIENNVSSQILTKVYQGDFAEVKSLFDKKFVQETTLLFGSESDGISEELLKACNDIRQIDNFGSTRSINVGVASGIAMYEWSRQWLKVR